MASIVEISNSALNQLGASTILSLTENSKNGRLCNARYETIRDSVLRSHPWNCAIKRVSLAANTTNTDWGFQREFNLPVDCLRVLQIEDYSSNYKIEGRKIVSNDTSIKLIYVATMTDPNEMDVLLRETISAALAADIAYAVTANAAIAREMKANYELKIKDARFVDATEGYNTDPTLGPSDQVISEDYINSRF